MKGYKVREIAGNRFGVYAVTEWAETLVKTFKMREGAERWVKKNG